jgi:hypothetical protein
VPEPFVLACFPCVAESRQAELWGITYPNIGSELRYLVDRGLLDRRAEHALPIFGGFTNPFDESEIVSRYDHDAGPFRSVGRWTIKTKGVTIMESSVPDLSVPRQLASYALTKEGLQLRESMSGEARAVAGDPLLSVDQLAERFNLGGQKENLRKRLTRLRCIDHDCFREVAPGERKPREAKYLYRLSHVNPIIDDMQKTSGERPAKKNLR